MGLCSVCHAFKFSFPRFSSIHSQGNHNSDFLFLWHTRTQISIRRTCASCLYKQVEVIPGSKWLLPLQIRKGLHCVLRTARSLHQTKVSLKDRRDHSLLGWKWAVTQQKLSSDPTDSSCTLKQSWLSRQAVVLLQRRSLIVAWKNNRAHQLLSVFVSVANHATWDHNTAWKSISHLEFCWKAGTYCMQLAFTLESPSIVQL